MMKPALYLAVILVIGHGSTNWSFAQGGSPAVYQSQDGRGLLKHAWAGGMNASQFGTLDIDLDGMKDLVVFDRVGNRVMPFLANRSEDNPGYVFKPEFAAYFPALQDWVIFEDYNGDGLEDIFTYSPGYASMKVYKNVSEAQLEFQLEVYPFLTSFQGGGYVNILVTYADYPAITDLDGDGDLDILTFYGLGSFVEKHRNMSMEKYGIPDSLDFIKTETCWGYFAESEESNDLTLDTCLGLVQSSKFKVQSGEERHTGSTFRILDLNGDGLLDLLLGDVDYPNLVALYNGGSEDTARMLSYDWNFPEYDQPVRLFSMPSAICTDLNYDGVKDLLVSPFDPNPLISDNFYSSWLYLNETENDSPVFHLTKRRFLQEDMVDVGAGAYPVLEDYNGDGLPDLFIGNYGKYDTSYYDQFLILRSDHIGQVALFENTGTMENPAFTLIMDDFAGISELNLNGIIPAFADLDGDGDTDMLTGSEDGRILFFENVALPGEPMDMTLRETYYQEIDVGNSSAPVIADLNLDGLPDLIIGEKGGNLNFYANAGKADQPDFQLVTDSLGKVNVTDYTVSLDGYSVPFIYTDDADQIHLFVGSEQGSIFFYPDIGSNLSGAFKEADPGSFLGISGFNPDRGFRTAVAVKELNGDGFADMIAGNFSGGLEFFSKKAAPPASEVMDSGLRPDFISVYPNPFTDQLNIAINGPVNLEIVSADLYDLTGRKILVNRGNDKAEVTLSNLQLPDAVYILKLQLKYNGRLENFYTIKKVLKKSKSK